MNKRHWGSILLALLLLLLLSSCNKSEEEPGTFETTSDMLPSLGSVLGENSGSFVASDVPSKGGGGGSRGEEPEAGNPDFVYAYQYTDLPEKGKTVEAYTNGLISEDVGFFIVDEDGEKTTPPSFVTESGTVFLSRSNPNTFTDLSMRMDWEGGNLAIRAWERSSKEAFSPPEGGATLPELEEEQKKDEEKDEEKPSEEDATETSAPAETPEPFTAQSAVEYLQQLSPASLGLEGSSMNDYRIYHTDGSARVDGLPCIRLRVYELRPETGTNTFLGTYLLASDRSSIYRLETEAGPPIKLDLPPGAG